MFACLMGKKQQLEFPAHSALLKRKCQLLFISPWLKIIANKKYTNKHKCLVILPLQCSSCKFPLKMTLNEKVLDKPSVIMTFAFRNVQSLHAVFVKMFPIAHDICKFYFHVGIFHLTINRYRYIDISYSLFCHLYRYLANYVIRFPGILQRLHLRCHKQRLTYWLLRKLRPPKIKT